MGLSCPLRRLSLLSQAGHVAAGFVLQQKGLSWPMRGALPRLSHRGGGGGDRCPVPPDTEPCCGGEGATFPIRSVIHPYTGNASFPSVLNKMAQGCRPTSQTNHSSLGVRTQEAAPTPGGAHRPPPGAAFTGTPACLWEARRLRQPSSRMAGPFVGLHRTRGSWPTQLPSHEPHLASL